MSCKHELVHSRADRSLGKSLAQSLPSKQGVITGVRCSLVLSRFLCLYPANNSRNPGQINEVSPRRMALKDLALSSCCITGRKWCSLQQGWKDDWHWIDMSEVTIFCWNPDLRYERWNYYVLWWVEANTRLPISEFSIFLCFHPRKRGGARVQSHWQRYSRAVGQWGWLLPKGREICQKSTCTHENAVQSHSPFLSFSFCGNSFVLSNLNWVAKLIPSAFPDWSQKFGETKLLKS